MSTVAVPILCFLDPALESSLQLLSEAAERSPQFVQGLLHGIDSFAELVRIDSQGFAASGAGDLRILLQPSDRLLDLVAAIGAGNRDDV